MKAGNYATGYTAMLLLFSGGKKITACCNKTKRFTTNIQKIILYDTGAKPAAGAKSKKYFTARLQIVL